VLDYLISNDIYDCSLQDIDEATDLSRKTVRKVVREMLNLDAVKPTREVRKAKMFQINKYNEYVKHLIELDRRLPKEHPDSLTRKVEAKIRA